MSDRAPIHLGSGAPVLLLHPFMMSQKVWKNVAPQLARSGRYEVFAPTMAGHNGGPRTRGFLDTGKLADHVEHQLDELGWDTAHVVGNSLGGWVAFELERRGRARTVTAIAPAGGWHRWSPAKYEIVGKFVLGAPVYVLVKLLKGRVLKLPFSRWLAHFPISATPDALSDEDLLSIIDDVSHCPAYHQLLVKSVLLPGLTELAHTRTPTYLVICEKDRVIPQPRFTRHFLKHIPKITEIAELEGVGHIPMFEDPDGVAELILGFLDRHSQPPAADATG